MKCIVENGEIFILKDCLSCGNRYGLCFKYCPFCLHNNKWDIYKKIDYDGIYEWSLDPAPIEEPDLCLLCGFTDEVCDCKVDYNKPRHRQYKFLGKGSEEFTQHELDYL